MIEVRCEVNDDDDDNDDDWKKCNLFCVILCGKTHQRSYDG